MRGRQFTIAKPPEVGVSWREGEWLVDVRSVPPGMAVSVGTAHGGSTVRWSQVPPAAQTLDQEEARG